MKPTEGPYYAEEGESNSGKRGFYVVTANGTPLWDNGKQDGGVCSLADARLLAKSWEMRENLAALEKAEHAHANCDECGGDIMPELCPECFPLFDAVRIQRRALLRSIEGE